MVSLKEFFQALVVSQTQMSEHLVQNNEQHHNEELINSYFSVLLHGHLAVSFFFKFSRMFVSPRVRWQKTGGRNFSSMLGFPLSDRARGKQNHSTDKQRMAYFRILTSEKSLKHVVQLNKHCHLIVQLKCFHLNRHTRKISPQT